MKRMGWAALAAAFLLGGCVHRVPQYEPPLIQPASLPEQPATQVGQIKNSYQIKKEQYDTAYKECLSKKKSGVIKTREDLEKCDSANFHAIHPGIKDRDIDLVDLFIAKRMYLAQSIDKKIITMDEFKIKSAQYKAELNDAIRKRNYDEEVAQANAMAANNAAREAQFEQQMALERANAAAAAAGQYNAWQDPQLQAGLRMLSNPSPWASVGLGSADPYAPPPAPPQQIAPFSCATSTIGMFTNTNCQ